jgi:integrase
MACIWKHPQSRYWFARFLDKDGRYRNASTKSTDRKTALKLAEEFETVAKARRTATLLAHLGPLAEDELSMISKEHLVAFRNALMARLSPKATNHYLKVVKMLFRAAKRDGYLVDDPSEFVETVKDKGHDRKRRRPFTLDQIRAVLAVADEEWRSMILCGLYTGQRIGDIARLTWANVDLERGQIKLTTRKTGAVLMIPMAAPLKEHLDTLPTPDARPELAPLHPRAFAIVTQQGRSGTLSNQFADLLAAAGLREKKPHRVTSGEGRDGRRESEMLSFHSLRHSAVTLLKEAGIPAAVVQKLIGHESAQMSELYTTVGEEALVKAAAAFPVL